MKNSDISQSLAKYNAINEDNGVMLVSISNVCIGSPILESIS